MKIKLTIDNLIIKQLNDSIGKNEKKIHDENKKIGTS